MKNIKKLLVLTLVFVMTMSVNSFAYTMYAPDGRTINVDYNSAQAWRNVGWYDAPVTVMYAPDGRTIVVYTSEVQSWRNVGWYTYSVTPSSTNNTSYKNEYAYVLKQLMKENYNYDPSFSLIYIDNDNIPELVYRYGESHAASADVFTMVNGKAVHLGNFGSFGNIYYKPKANCFVSSYQGMGTEFVDIFKISSGSAVKIISFYGHDDGFGPTEYKINNKKVNYSQYMSTKASYGLESATNGYTSDFIWTNNIEKYRLNSQTIARVLQ